MYPAGTTVITETGPVDVRRLDGNEKLKVALPSGQTAFRPLRRVYMGGAPGKVFCLSTSGGRRFCATPDQPFAIGLEATRQYHDLFLAKREGLGFFLALGNGMFRDNIETRLLFKRAEPASKESVWLLSSHLNPYQASYEQALLSCQYGIPIFPSGSRAGERTLPEELFRRLLIEVNTFARARRLLGDLHLDEELPHWLMRALPEAELPHRHFLDVVYFGGEAGTHQLTQHPMSENLRVTGEKLRHLMTRQRQVESVSGRFAVAARLETTRKDPFSDVQERLRIGHHKPLFLLPLAYARPGMVCAAAGPDGIREERIEQSVLERYEGPVYGLETEGDEPLLAGDLVMGLPRLAAARPAESAGTETSTSQDASNRGRVSS